MLFCLKRPDFYLLHTPASTNSGIQTLNGSKCMVEHMFIEDVDEAKKVYTMASNTLFEYFKDADLKQAHTYLALFTGHDEHLLIGTDLQNRVADHVLWDWRNYGIDYISNPKEQFEETIHEDTRYKPFLS